MRPFLQMEAKYAENPQELPFQYYLDWHLLYGFVFSTPEFFVMGRAINRKLAEENGVLLLEPAAFGLDVPMDTWYLHAFAGDLRKVWSIVPWPLPYIAFERIYAGKRDLRFHSMEALAKHFNVDLAPASP